MKNLKGFTLIELMIVMVIIGILLSLLLPGVFQGREQAVALNCKSNLYNCGIALFAYTTSTHGEGPNPASGWVTALTTGTSPYLDTDKVTKCPKGGETYTQNFTDGENLWEMTSGQAMLTCSTHNVVLYGDFKVDAVGARE